MKKLLAIIAAIVMTSAVSAQQNTVCTVTTKCGVHTFVDTPNLGLSNSGGVITIKNTVTGEILETIECKGSGALINCGGTSVKKPEEVVPVLPKLKVVPESVARPERTRRTRGSGSPVSATIGLGSNIGIGGVIPGARSTAL